MSAIATPERAKAQVSADLSGFLSALTELSDRFGIAVADGAQLFVMEKDDRLFRYTSDAESRLLRA